MTMLAMAEKIIADKIFNLDISRMFNIFIYMYMQLIVSPKNLIILSNFKYHLTKKQSGQLWEKLAALHSSFAHHNVK